MDPDWFFWYTSINCWNKSFRANWAGVIKSIVSGFVTGGSGNLIGSGLADRASWSGVKPLNLLKRPLLEAIKALLAGVEL